MLLGFTSRVAQVLAACAVLVIMATGAARADSESSPWYQNYFKPKAQTIRGNLGGPSSASKPSVTGREYKSARKSGRSSGVRTASLGNPDLPTRSKPVTGGGGVNWVANSGCLNGTLKSIIYSVAASYGSVTVSSTCRSAGHNRSVGGAPKSMHLSGDAADFRVHGNVSATYAALRANGSVGGLKHYGGGLFHIDTGARRSW